jgi:arylsulfatase A-like enzyme
VRNAAKGPFLLFDLVADPSETRDLAADQPERLAELIDLLRAQNARDAVPMRL